MAVTYEGLEVRYPGGIPAADRARAEAALADAEAAVCAEARVNSAELPAVLERLVYAAAMRLFANPLGRASETIADFTWRADGLGTGTVLTDAERREIRRAVGMSDVVSVRTPLGWEPDDVRAITPTGPYPGEVPR